jgi:hypothetical protein
VVWPRLEWLKNTRDTLHPHRPGMCSSAVRHHHGLSRQ